MAKDLSVSPVLNRNSLPMFHGQLMLATRLWVFRNDCQPWLLNWFFLAGMDDYLLHGPESALTTLYGNWLRSLLGLSSTRKCRRYEGQGLAQAPKQEQHQGHMHDELQEVETDDVA
jgi:hypothetical protein